MNSNATCLATYPKSSYELIGNVIKASTQSNLGMYLLFVWMGSSVCATAFLKWRIKGLGYTALTYILANLIFVFCIIHFLFVDNNLQASSISSILAARHNWSGYLLALNVVSKLHLMIIQSIYLLLKELKYGSKYGRQYNWGIFIVIGLSALFSSLILYLPIADCIPFENSKNTTLTQKYKSYDDGSSMQEHWEFLSPEDCNQLHYQTITYGVLLGIVSSWCLAYQTHYLRESIRKIYLFIGMISLACIAIITGHLFLNEGGIGYEIVCLATTFMPIDFLLIWWMHDSINVKKEKDRQKRIVIMNLCQCQPNVKDIIIKKLCEM